MKVLIVGAGVAGLTLAQMLHAAEIDFDIIERSENGEPERQGFIIGLWSSGRSVLKKLALSDAFDSKAAPTHEARFFRGDGSLLKRISFRDLEKRDGAGLAGIKRRDLYSILLTRLDANTIRYKQTLTNIVQKGEVVTVTFSDDSTMTYDLVVGADGAKSWVREHSFQQHLETYTNWRVWCAWVPKKFETRHALAAYIEPKELGVVVHTHDAAMVWLVTPTDHTVWDTEEGRVERLTKYFSSITTLIPGALHHGDDHQIPVSDFMEVTMSHLVQGRIALIGDAAHCLGPYTGFSSSMAMEDAYILGRELTKAQNGSGTIDDALHCYEKIRMPRIELVRKINSTIRRIVLSESPLARKFFNLVLRVIPAGFIRYAAGLVTRGNV